MKKLNKKDKRVRYISFSRNFGKESAISAGLSAVSGDCAVVIDCDLQHPPEKIIEMYHLWEAGYEIVEGIKRERGDEKKMHGIGAKLFYSVISRMAGFDMANSSDFKLLDRKVIDVINKMPERGFFRAISFWVGYNKATVEYDVKERVEGESKWSTRGLVKYALSNISSYSTAPMQTVTVLGVVMLIISVIFGVWALIDKIRRSHNDDGDFKSYWDFCKRVSGTELNRRALECLIKGGTLDGLDLNRNEMLHNLDLAIECAAKESQIYAGGQLDMFSAFGDSSFSNDPVFGKFADFRIDDLQGTYNEYARRGTTKEALQAYVVEQIRRFKPQVTVAHDFKGEYGHGMHMVYTDLLVNSLEITNDATKFPESAEKYGVWDIPKTYIQYDVN